MSTRANNADPKLLAVDGGGHTDALGRTAFARHLLQLIQIVDANSGAVIGLEGEWGSGKSWVLHQMETLLEEVPEEQRPLVLRFNPWMVSGATALVETFLSQLAAEIAQKSSVSDQLKNGAGLASKLIEYAGVLSSAKHFSTIANLLLPGTGLVLEAVSAATDVTQQAVGNDLKTQLDRWQQPDKLSVTAARQTVVEQLQAIGRRIVVVVDDLDRIAPHDVGAMIQAIKAVADFPNVVYVLAYDVANTAKSLESTLNLDAGEGRRYLEKIVHLELPIPDVLAFKMQAYAIGQLKAVLLPEVKDHETKEREDIDKALPLAAAIMQTPRDVLRLCTRLHIVAPAMSGEVNLADILLIEALQLKAPAVLTYVKQNLEALLVKRLEQYDPHLGARGLSIHDYSNLGLPEDEQERRQAAKKKGWQEHLSEPSLRHPIKTAMVYLFDEAGDKAWGQQYEHAACLRIQRLRNWLYWRSFVEHREAFSNSEILNAFTRPSSIKSSAAWSSPAEFESLCALIADLADDATSADAMAFVQVFIDAEEKFGAELLMQWGMGYGPQEALKAVLRLDQPDKRKEAIAHLLATASVWISYGMVAVAYRDAFGTNRENPLRENKRLIPDEKSTKQFAKSWTDKALSVLTQMHEPCPSMDAYTLAHRIQNLDGDLKKTREIVHVIVNRPNGLDILFCNSEFEDDRLRTFGLDPQDFLPEESKLLAVIDNSPGFEERRRFLVEHWRRKVEERNQQASDPAN